jgi:hypothetical protein
MFGLGRKQQQQAGVRLDTYASVVEQLLASLGTDPVQARLNTQEGYGWTFRRGSAVIEIYITHVGGQGYLQVLAPIIHLPAQGLLPFYRRLLELNLQLTNAAFGLYLDVVYVFSERQLDGLDATETNQIISLVAQYADELDDKLVAEFGGRLYTRI